MARAKPYDIPKREVWEAFKKVRANQGAAGVDGQTIADFEADLTNNLYKLWNRLSSGSYLPPPVRRVDIPKSDGKTRPLGIPTVADRIAPMVTPMDTDPVNRRWTRSTWRGSDAGVVTGSLISTSRPSSTASRRIC
jgi:RNA-directed DNA polymerase